MDRRNVILALTGAAAAPLLLGSGAHGQTTTDMLDPASYTADTLQIGTLSKTLSQIALHNSKNPVVLRFAKLEIDEQTAVAQSLTSDADPAPAALTDQQQTMVQSLQGLTGAAFDIAYIKGQIQGHNQLGAIQNEFLASDTDVTANLVHVALIAAAFIETHLSVLHALLPIVIATG